MAVLLSSVSFMLGVVYAYSRKQTDYAECRNADCHDAECRGALVVLCVGVSDELKNRFETPLPSVKDLVVLKCCLVNFCETCC
jgi:hypothetical protein